MSKDKPIITVIDHTKTEQGYGQLGEGVFYIIDAPDYISTITRFDKNWYGVYQGPNNPKQYWKTPDQNGNYPDWYDLPPIDETDANAKRHDLDYDKVNAAGGWGVMATRTTSADEAYIKRANRTIEKYKSGENDDITGVPITEKTKNAARNGKYFFSGTKSIKNIPTKVNKAINKVKDTMIKINVKIEQSVEDMVNPANYGY
jgi:hypothetical protein